MNIYVRRASGWLLISDDEGNYWRFLYYSKREAIKRFKERFGHKNKRGVKIIDYTKGDEDDCKKSVR